jgi:uncharacterized delta-60 repeat protein
MSSTLYSNTTNATLTIGGVSGTFSVTTQSAPPGMPDKFTFVDRIGVALNTVITSDPIIVSGINIPASIAISGGEYSVNGGAFTSAAGTVTNGASVLVRLTSSGSYATPTIATLTIGGVSDIFSVTTMDVVSVLDSFMGDTNDSVYAFAMQPDGKLVIGGTFKTVDNTARNYISRLKADGTLDPGFVPGDVDNQVYCIAMQPDGKMLIGGIFTHVGSQPRNGIARLNADGTVDPTFVPDAGGWVYTIAVQRDGKILIGGGFTMAGTVPRGHIARLNTDGTLDTSFINPSAGHNVLSMAVQADGKILIAGQFTTVGDQTRNYIARLNADGTLDQDFDPYANNVVDSIMVQADGKIVIGGYFTTLGVQPYSYVARLNADGTTDSSFVAKLNGGIETMALQANGKILIGGQFTTVDGNTHDRVARLNANGTEDPSVDQNADDFVWSVGLQADGKILVGGLFTSMTGTTRNHIARLTNTEDVVENLTASADGYTVTWSRDGAGPEVWRVTFEQSTDGNVWSNLGEGTRIPGGWQLTGLALPMNQNVSLRARGYASGGWWNSSTSLIESVRSVNLVATTYTITATAGPGGSIIQSGVLTVLAGGNAHFDIAPDPGYQILSVIVDGANKGAVNSYTFTNVQANHTIAAYFKAITYTITATAGANGTISSPGVNTVNPGSSMNFTITPNAGYHIADVLVDSVSSGPTATYGFTNVTANHTIAASFSANAPFIITASTGTAGGGSISPSGDVSVLGGASQKFTFTPDAGNRIADVVVDSVSKGALTSYTFTNVTAAHGIIVTFEQDVYTITATMTNYDYSTPGNGSITVNGSAPPATVNAGASITYTITPNAGYVVYSVLVDGVQQGGVTSYTFSDVSANHTIDAYVRPITYTVTTSAGAGGSITPVGTSTFNIHTNPIFAITPNAGYSVTDVKVDGGSVGAVANYTFTDITRNHTIAATFALNGGITITATAGSNGSITPSGDISVAAGAKQKFTFTPDPGYRVKEVVVDTDPPKSGLTSYTFTNVQTPHTISVSFEPDVYSINLTAAAGGSVTVTGTAITPTLPVTVNGGESSTITVSPGASVTITVTAGSLRNLNDNGAVYKNITTYTLTNIRKDHTINVYFR